jgi:hypothetical protein
MSSVCDNITIKVVNNTLAKDGTPVALQVRPPSASRLIEYEADPVLMCSSMRPWSCREVELRLG